VFNKSCRERNAYFIYSIIFPQAFIIMRSVIPVVFYVITTVQCVYWSDTATFIGRI